MLYLFKDSSIEKLLKFFIAVIYTELLKTVDLKIFYKINETHMRKMV